MLSLLSYDFMQRAMVTRNDEIGNEIGTTVSAEGDDHFW